MHQVTASASLKDPSIRQIIPSPDPTSATATKRPSLTTQAAGSDTEFFSRLTAAPAIDLPRVTFIGDSIMQGATPMIEDVFGEDNYNDAARKRKMEEVPALVKTLSREGHLSHVVVIHLGSNRPVEVPVFDNGMEALLDLGVERAIFINVHRPIGWEYYLNRNFMEGVARWQQAEMIDWDALAHSEQGWFIRDQTHLSYAGSEAYVNAIQEKLGTDP